jgi:tRNA U38,U39,U40 pseudouridine synthase TruA
MNIIMEICARKLGKQHRSHREVAKLTAPPAGLYLEKVCYESDELPEEIVPVLRV